MPNCVTASSSSPRFSSSVTNVLGRPAPQRATNLLICAVVDLVLQPLPVHVLAFRAGDMSFGKTGHADGEFTRLTDELDELIGELESALGHLELPLAAGRVAAQGQNVFDPARARFRQ